MEHHLEKACCVVAIQSVLCNFLDKLLQHSVSWSQTCYGLSQQLCLTQVNKVRPAHHTPVAVLPATHPLALHLGPLSTNMSSSSSSVICLLAFLPWDCHGAKYHAIDYVYAYKYCFQISDQIFFYVIVKVICVKESERNIYSFTSLIILAITCIFFYRNPTCDLLVLSTGNK